MRDVVLFRLYQESCLLGLAEVNRFLDAFVAMELLLSVARPDVPAIGIRLERQRLIGIVPAVLRLRMRVEDVVLVDAFNFWFVGHIQYFSK